MQVAVTLSDSVGIAPACEALAISRATFYRHHKQKERSSRIRPVSHRALSETEQMLILDILHSERFADVSPAQVYATLLDESIYHCSIRTMYRILEAHGEVKERRNQLP